MSDGMRIDAIGGVKNDKYLEKMSDGFAQPKVKINSYSQVTDSILMENVNIGRYSEIRKAIIDKNVEVPPYTKIGVNREDDLRRGFYVSEGGVTVVPKNARL